MNVPSQLTATKEFTFDCAHMLEGHEGLCQNLHGHTYKLEVEVSNACGTISSGASFGMVMDFKDLKEIVKRTIVDRFDHSFVFYEYGGSLERAIADLLISHGRRVTKVNYRPTAENMASAFFLILSEELDRTNVHVESVTVWETPTSYAKAKN